MLGEQHCEGLSSLSGWSSDTPTHFMLRKPGNQETRKPGHLAWVQTLPFHLTFIDAFFLSSRFFTLSLFFLYRMMNTFMAHWGICIMDQIPFCGSLFSCVGCLDRVCYIWILVSCGTECSCQQVELLPKMIACKFYSLISRLAYKQIYIFFQLTN